MNECSPETDGCHDLPVVGFDVEWLLLLGGGLLLLGLVTVTVAALVAAWRDGWQFGSPLRRR